MENIRRIVQPGPRDMPMTGENRMKMSVKHLFFRKIYYFG